MSETILGYKITYILDTRDQTELLLALKEVHDNTKLNLEEVITASKKLDC